MTAARPATADALECDLAVVQGRDRLPSVVAGVVRHSTLVWHSTRGSAPGPAAGAAVSGADVQYRIGSLTKSMTAVLILQCRDEGLLDLGDSVRRLGVDSPWPDTTMRQLLAHAGGLPAEPPGPWWERHDDSALAALPERLDGQHLAIARGAHFHYSNVGYALLGAVVERVRGAPWREVLRERLLEPLGMLRTTYAPVRPHAQGWSVHPWSGRLHAEPHTDTGAMAPAGQLWATVGDLARWAAFWLDPAPVLAATTAAEMRVPTAAQPGDLGAAYGLGLSLDAGGGGLRFGHGGSMPGFVAALLVDPDEQTAAVTVANGTTGGVGQLASSLLDTLHRHEPTPSPAWEPEPEVDGADELLGPWFWGNTAFTLVIRDAMLTLDNANPGRRSRFVRVGEDSWRGLDAYFTGETLTVARDSAGIPERLELATYDLRRHPYA
ncbi:MAG: beta-lactamase [Nocardioidaceae bacterium]|jgi:CubicO group peptidase (beta-lactamase class C family)|nr:beta-lactamase [Nocardioidaceae bacterium]